MSRKSPNVPTIWLIPEDETGYFVFQAIMRERKINARLVRRGTASGVAELAFQIEELLDTLLRVFRKGDCIIVLHDTDDSVQAYRDSYERIRQVCELEKFRQHVTRLEAIQEIESWLLADNGLCKWLGRKPRSFDNKPQPSREFARILNEKHKMKWTNTTKPKF